MSAGSADYGVVTAGRTDERAGGGGSVGTASSARVDCAEAADELPAAGAATAALRAGTVAKLGTGDGAATAGWDGTTSRGG